MGKFKRQWTVILQFVWSIESRKGNKVGNKLRKLGFMVPPHWPVKARYRWALALTHGNDNITGNNLSQGLITYSPLVTVIILANLYSFLQNQGRQFINLFYKSRNWDTVKETCQRSLTTLQDWHSPSGRLIITSTSMWRRVLEIRAPGCLRAPQESIWLFKGVLRDDQTEDRWAQEKGCGVSQKKTSRKVN